MQKFDKELFFFQGDLISEEESCICHCCCTCLDCLCVFCFVFIRKMIKRYQLCLTEFCVMSHAGELSNNFSLLIPFSKFLSVNPKVTFFYSGDGTLRKNPQIWKKWSPQLGLSLFRFVCKIELLLWLNG